ncbi:MAG: pyrroline-5-carboxylate reductase [Phycisphaerales bacterium]|nr:pyrroline-5-carboxylate reductase [Phycisphaerales bacterium]
MAGQHSRTVVFGGGSMGSALVLGGIRSGRTAGSGWLVVEPDQAKHASFVAQRVECVRSVAEAARRGASGDVWLLAVKPQALAGLVAEIAGAGMDCGRLVISILAGTPTARLESLLGPGARVIRAMPNTPAQIGKGITAIALGRLATDEDAAAAIRLFEAVGGVGGGQAAGGVVGPIDESLMDAFTAVAGSGPAYVFYLAEAMTEAARALGFDDATAERVVRATIVGAAGLFEGTDAHPGALRAAVTSKGGTTEAACRVLDSAGVQEVFVRALTAARDRGRELAGS